MNSYELATAYYLPRPPPQLVHISTDTTAYCHSERESTSVRFVLVTALSLDGDIIVRAHLGDWDTPLLVSPLSLCHFP